MGCDIASIWKTTNRKAKRRLRFVTSSSDRCDSLFGGVRQCLLLQPSESISVADPIPNCRPPQIGIVLQNDMRLAATCLQQKRIIRDDLSDDPKLLNEIAIVIAFRRGMNRSRSPAGPCRVLRLSIDDPVTDLERPSPHLNPAVSMKAEYTSNAV